MPNESETAAEIYKIFFFLILAFLYTRYKNKLLTKWENESSIYTRIKNVRCDVDGDILIVEELN